MAKYQQYYNKKIKILNYGIIKWRELTSAHLNNLEQITYYNQKRHWPKFGKDPTNKRKEKKYKRKR